MTDLEPIPSRKRCPSCQQETLEGGIIDDYVANIRGFEIVIRNIERDRCSNCGEQCYAWSQCLKIDQAIRDARKAGVRHDIGLFDFRLDD